MTTLNSTCIPPPCWGEEEVGCDDKVLLNLDVAGLGVISSYLVSAVLAVISICVAYFTESLPEAYYNDFDRAIIHNKTGRLKIWRGLSRYPQAKRVKAFAQFVLVLSDQQIVTGICVVVGALVQQDDLTVADFYVVTALVWFSSTIHLATLMMLKDYFRAYPSRYILRTVFMIIILALLITALIVAAWSDLFRWANDQPPVYPGLHLSCIFFSSRKDAGLALTAIGSIAWIIILFLSAIISITTGVKGLAKTVLFGISRCLDNPEARELLRSSCIRNSFLEFVQSEIEQRSLEGTGVWKFRLVLSLHLFLGSFWLHVGVVICTSMCSVFFFAKAYASRNDIEISFEIGYGQILPILLLILPFLTLFESVRVVDMKDKSHERYQNVEQVFPHIKQSGQEHGASTDSVLPLVLQPPSVRTRQEFDLKKDEIKRLFPLEYETLAELTGNLLIQSKQTLLALLLKARTDRAARITSCRWLFQLTAIIYLMYSFPMTYLLLANPSLTSGLVYFPFILIGMILIIPYAMALLSLRQGGKSEKKERLLKLMRLRDRAAKEEKFIRETKSTSTATTIQFPPRRKWTV